MTHEEAVAQVIGDYSKRVYHRGVSDCATLCADYIGLRTGTIPDFEDEGRPPTVRRVSEVLGEPTGDVGTGCVLLCPDGMLAVHLGYCVLTMIEGVGLARAEPDNIKAGWVV